MITEEIKHYYELKGLGITTYCKVNASDKYITLTFGKGAQQFHIMVYYAYDKPDIINLAQINSDVDCIDGDTPANLEKGAICFIKLVLYAMKRWFPSVTAIHFVDDSKITCLDSSISMLLPFDYIAKYGKTWYEMHFQAHIDANELHHDCSSDSIAGYYRSLEVFTQPLERFENTRFWWISGIAVYQTLYKSSATLREFIEKVRIHLGEEYYGKGAHFLATCMKHIGIHPIVRWKIMMNDVEVVADWSREEMIKLPTSIPGKKSHYQFTHEPDAMWHDLSDYHMQA